MYDKVSIKEKKLRNLYVVGHQKIIQSCLTLNDDGTKNAVFREMYFQSFSIRCSLVAWLRSLKLFKLVLKSHYRDYFSFEYMKKAIGC